MIIGSHFCDPTAGWVARDGPRLEAPDRIGSQEGGAGVAREICITEEDPLSAAAVRNARAVDDRLRELAPAVKVAREDITLLTRYEHVAAGLRDWRVFSSTSRPWHDPNSVRPELLLTDRPAEAHRRARRSRRGAVATGIGEDGRRFSRGCRGAREATEGRAAPSSTPLRRSRGRSFTKYCQTSWGFRLPGARTCTRSATWSGQRSGR